MISKEEAACSVSPVVGYSSVVRRYLVAGAVMCSLLWTVIGVSTLAVAFHEHSHHAETHDHHDALEVVLHGHAHEGSSDHDHELSAPLSASRSFGSVGPPIMVSQACDHSEDATRPKRGMTTCLSGARDLGPPRYLMHCVLLT